MKKNSIGKEIADFEVKELDRIEKMIFWFLQKIVKRKKEIKPELLELLHKATETED